MPNKRTHSIFRWVSLINDRYIVHRCDITPRLRRVTSMIITHPTDVNVTKAVANSICGRVSMGLKSSRARSGPRWPVGWTSDFRSMINPYVIGAEYGLPRYRARRTIYDDSIKRFKKIG